MLLRLPVLFSFSTFLHVKGIIVYLVAQARNPRVVQVHWVVQETDSVVDIGMRVSGDLHAGAVSCSLLPPLKKAKVKKTVYSL